MWITSCILAGAAGSLAWSLTGALPAALAPSGASQTFESLRLERLRRGSWSFRWFGGLGNECAQAPLVRRLVNVPELERSLSLRTAVLPWRANEYLGVKIIESMLGAAIAGTTVFGLTHRPLAGIAAGLLVGLGWLVAARIRIAIAVRNRLHRVRSRLPYLLDVLALLLESGATLSEALASLADQPGDEPAQQEVAAMLATVRRGHSLRDALVELNNRLRDPEIGEVLSATATALELGSPLAATLLALSQQLRLRRVQELETRAARANVNIQFPAFLVLVACLVVVVACFLLPPLSSWNNVGM